MEDGLKYVAPIKITNCKRRLRAIIMEPKIGPENRKYTQTPEYTQVCIFGYYRISTLLSRELFWASDNRVEIALSDNRIFGFSVSMTMALKVTNNRITVCFVFTRIMMFYVKNQPKIKISSAQSVHVPFFENFVCLLPLAHSSQLAEVLYRYGVVDCFHYCRSEAPSSLNRIVR